ncbi:ATP-binding protein [Pectinatus brassicae]|uniref:MinD superfamily P-loop ATPase n=1 Tax=Pectinatus brassicae TaxID=862415 RepID=A0A840UMQ5_9FIRM|nr:ATP-binding protein [Pectinatus brassicae]MBB5337490.1 MinD superfamily P-loop ATPase [Pectinatus brassicae]
MRQLLILSGKGGTGKTTIAGALIHLSKAMAMADCDVDAPNLHLITKMQNAPETENFYGMDKAVIDTDKCVKCGKCRQICRFDAIKDDCTINAYECEGCGACQIVCPVGAISLQKFTAGKMDLYTNGRIFSTAELKMGSGNSGLLVDSVKKRLKQAAEDKLFAIIDGSPGIGCPVIASLNGVDMVLVVAEASIAGVNDMKRIIATAQRFRIKIAVCINKYDVNLEQTKQIENFCIEEDLLLVGKIPFDKEVIRAVNNNISIMETECEASKAIFAIYDNIKDFFA